MSSKSNMYYVNTGVKGTHGYIDQYYVLTHRLTRKSDVYSFGVLLLVVLCGRPPLDKSLDEEQFKLAEWAQHCYGKGLLDQIVDPYIKGDISSESLNVYVNIAIECLNLQPKLRPTMAEVVVSLESALKFQEKSTEYTLVEIMPDDYMKDVECLILEGKDTNHTHEYSGEGNIDISNVQNHKEQSFDTKRVSCFPLGATSKFSPLGATWKFSVNQNKKTLRNNKAVLSSTTHISQEEILQSSKLMSFTFNDLSVATRKFHRDLVIGKGGFGTVYRGTLVTAYWGTGLVIAVKRLQRESRQGQHEWLTEIKCLGQLSHPNIIKLIGYCSEKKNRFLVYEFMPRGTLRDHLYERGPDVQRLSWKLRISIALGAAKGLAYLHSPEVNLIHRDIKSTNILIDSKYNAKLSDFGMARDGPEPEGTHVITCVQGTFGYLDPEYFHSNQLTMKSDVYSIGVVLLEIFTGRKAFDFKLSGEERNLVSWAKSRSKEHLILDIIDADVKGQYTERAAKEAFTLALRCTLPDSKSRPDAKQVVKELEQILASENLKNIYQVNCPFS